MQKTKTCMQWKLVRSGGSEVTLNNQNEIRRTEQWNSKQKTKSYKSTINIQHLLFLLISWNIIFLQFMHLNLNTTISFELIYPNLLDLHYKFNSGTDQLLGGETVTLLFGPIQAKFNNLTITSQSFTISGNITSTPKANVVQKRQSHCI